MHKILASLILGLLFTPSAFSQKPGQAEIWRDEFGIPHVFARDLPSAAYAVGYAQAEDRLVELLKNYRRASGTMAEVFGPEHYKNDLVARMWRHKEIAQEKYAQVSEEMREMMSAFILGIRHYMDDNPHEVPSWAQKIEPADVVALGRFIIWGWPMGEAGGDLQRAGIPLDDMAYRGSNQMAIHGSKTASGKPMAVIDPHLSWYDEFRFYQIRIYAGDFAVSGVSILGSPLPSLGHNRWLSIAMTTGGPDTSDIFEEELNPENPRQYKVDGQWRDMTVRKITINVKKSGMIVPSTVELEFTRHGPVVAHKAGKAYTMAIPYADEVGLTDQTYRSLTARNLSEAIKAFSGLHLMAQNVMIATVQGDIYYVRNGRVPMRAPGTDPSKPIPGHTTANDWKGLHPFSDLLQITNPPSGAMHNNNVSPFAMMKNSPLVPEGVKAPYLYNATRQSPRHQRGEMMLELLDRIQKVSIQDAINLAFDTEVYKAATWQQRLEKMNPAQPSSDAAKMRTLITQWNRKSDPDSAGALAFYAFKKALGADRSRQWEPSADLTDQDLTTALDSGAAWLKQMFGTIQAPYGKYFRVGRRGAKENWPVGGGSLQDVGMATTRAISFEKVNDLMVGRGGQTSTQIVVLTDPPESYTVVPLGVSDDSKSKHFDDQAKKLFSTGRAVPTYFLNRNQLERHVTDKKKLKIR